MRWRSDGNRRNQTIIRPLCTQTQVSRGADLWTQDTCNVIHRLLFQDLVTKQVHGAQCVCVYCLLYLTCTMGREWVNCNEAADGFFGLDREKRCIGYPRTFRLSCQQRSQSAWIHKECQRSEKSCGCATYFTQKTSVAKQTGFCFHCWNNEVCLHSEHSTARTSWWWSYRAWRMLPPRQRWKLPNASTFLNQQWWHCFAEAFSLAYLLPKHVTSATWYLVQPSFQKYTNVLRWQVSEVSEEQANAEFAVWSHQVSAEAARTACSGCCFSIFCS